jgi:XTP/dITP diphosphohydrolase
MNKPVLFTGNQRKIAEAKVVFDEYGIVFEAFSADIDEIQHHDPTEIAKAKARAAYEEVHRPLVINDSSWSIPALNGFPGGYMKDINQWFTAEDWLSLLKDKEDKSVVLHERTIYYDGNKMSLLTR